MYPVLVLFTGTVYFLLSALQLLMLARAVVSWLPVDEDGVFFRFVHIATEPVIYPVRAVLERSDFFASMPVDMSLFISLLLVSIVQLLLPVV
jgi:YGGT family.